MAIAASVAGLLDLRLPVHLLPPNPLRHHLRQERRRARTGLRIAKPRAIAHAALSIAMAMLVLDPVAQAAPLLPGDPEAGKTLVLRQACGSCHQIPRLQEATGVVGPSLAGIADRVYLAGHILNTPDAMIAWLRDPQALKPGNPMPATGLTEHEAGDIAAYLFTLK